MGLKWFALECPDAAEIDGVDYHHDVFDQVSVDSLPDLGRKVVEEGESSLPCSWLMFWHTEN